MTGARISFVLATPMLTISWRVISTTVPFRSRRRRDTGALSTVTYTRDHITARTVIPAVAAAGRRR